MSPMTASPGGWSHREFAQALGAAVGRQVRALSLPPRLLHAARRPASRSLDPPRQGEADRRTGCAGFAIPTGWRGPSGSPRPVSVWHPAVATPGGLRATADWYRASGWL